MSSCIYKVFTPAQWSEFSSSHLFCGAPVDLSDGYIHFSTSAQLLGTLNKHFGASERVIIGRVTLANLADGLSEALKWEPSRGGDLFPHLYASLPWDMIDAHWQISQSKGLFELPEGLLD